MDILDSLKPLSAENSTALLRLGDTVLRYRLDPASGAVDFLPLPAGRIEDCRERPPSRPSHPVFAGRKSLMTWDHREKDPLVQVAVRGFPYAANFSAGETLRDHFAAKSLRFVRQDIKAGAAKTSIETRLRSEAGFEALHRVVWHDGAPGVFIETELVNTGDESIEVEMLSSFSLADLSPFAADDAPGRLRLHRFRSAWSNEGMHAAEDLEALNLERTWGGAPVFERFGQTGSMPVRRYFPFLALEDTAADVIWGAQLVWHGSWQMEVYRRGDGVNLSGGHGDFERAHWMKRLAPGETLAAPKAMLATAAGGIDGLCRRLLALQECFAHPEPPHEEDLPILFNEWCSTWGKPSHDYLMRTAERLKGTPTRYIVIDDGWAERPKGRSIQFNGDWNVDTEAFPGGLAPTCEALRAKGFIPGLWFEFEPCTRGTEAFAKTDHLLQRNGRVLEVGNRRFWDFRDPWTFDYLTEKVIRRLRDSGFGYLKVDYNECIGLGCDGAESLGEGLRQHLLKVREFFEKIRREVPGIVIENCSSGGHREEPGMIALTSMSSFSDAHETVEIPLIAAALQRLIPVRKLQVWAVLRPDDAPERLDYSLAATFLGRMCVSGDLVELDDVRFGRMREAQEFYTRAVPVLRDGISQIHGKTGPSRRYPSGWQAVVRTANGGGTALVVLHTFEGGRTGPHLTVPLPEPVCGSRWHLAGDFGAPQAAEIAQGELRVPMPEDFRGMAWLLRGA